MKNLEIEIDQALKLIAENHGLSDEEKNKIIPLLLYLRNERWFTFNTIAIIMLDHGIDNLETTLDDFSTIADYAIKYNMEFEDGTINTMRYRIMYPGEINNAE